MGMYNEVYRRCPDCGGRGVMQIHQIVLGFGQFSLDSPQSIADELTEDQVAELVEAVEREKWFYCDDCKEAFSLDHTRSKDNKITLLSKLL